MICSLIAAFVLTLTGFTPIYEEIRITDDLSIRAEYLPPDTKTEHEGMLITVEDFVIIQTELEFGGKECTMRIESLTSEHLTFIEEMQGRCRKELTSFELDLVETKAKNAKLKKERDDARFRLKIYKWVTWGLSAALVGTGTYIFISR